MANLLPAFDTPPPPQASMEQDARPAVEGNGNDESTSSRPLSGPGSSRQTRRLHLRNAGFRGGTVPPRRVTPKSGSSNEWEATKANVGLSDDENTPPPWSSPPATTDPRGGTALQEIDSSSQIRARKQRHRAQHSRQLARSSGEHGDIDRPVSPLSPKATIRPRGLKTKAKIVPRRRSLSAEANKYIEHLETQLAEVQSRLDAATRSNTGAEKSSSVRTLAMEAERLQEELDAWEEMFDERLREEVDKHRAIESSLQERIHSMESDADEMRIRIEELGMEVESANGNLQAVERANTLLEKRVEMMSELLAASKVDLYAGTPAHSRRHSRLKSMVPLFPSAKSLGTSPERQSNTQPSSPRPMSPRMMSYMSTSTTSPISPPHRKAASTSDASPPRAHSVSEMMSDADSVFSEALTAGDSMTSAENPEGISSLNAWGIPVMHQPRNKPARRMRRFVGGSMGPKPLILPSTNQQSQYGPTSAPPLERRETSPGYFPTPTRGFVEHEIPMGRRRSSTTANEMKRCEFSSSPMSATSPYASRNLGFRDSRSRDFGSRDFGSRDFGRPRSSDSQSTTRRPFSIGSPVGRSLMEELNNAWSHEGHLSIDQACGLSDGVDSSPNELYMSRIPEDEERPLTSERDIQRVGLDSTNCPIIDASGYARTFEAPVIPEITTQSPSTATLGPTSEPSSSSSNDPVLAPPEQTSTTAPSAKINFFERMRLIFGDLCRSPVTLARHLVQTAQTRMRIPEPLRNVQWWLVSFLLGPMAKRRMLARSAKCPSSPLCTRPPDDDDPGGEDTHLLNERPRTSGTDRSPNEAEPPDDSPNLRQRRSSTKNRDRPLHRPPCPACRLQTSSQQHQQQQPLLSKHSPWLWLKFSLTLAFAIGTAFKEGPGSLLTRTAVCPCRVKTLGDPARGRKMLAAE